MATDSKIKASLGRTSDSLERLVKSRKKIDKRVKGLENRIVVIREALKTGRGQKIRGDITRALRAATAIGEDLELLTTRAQRLDFKARNLKLDLEFGPSASGGHQNQELLRTAQSLRDEVAKYISEYSKWHKQVSERRSELKKYSINAEWHYKIDLCIDSLRAGYDELGLSRLLYLAYGPDTPPDHRRRAIGEVLSWGHTIQDIELIRFTTNHLKSYLIPPERFSASDRELLLRIEGHRQINPFEHEDFLLYLLDALRRGTEDAFLAAANLAATAHVAQLPDFGRNLQVMWINRALAVRKLEPIFLNEALSDVPFDQVDCDIDPATEISNGALVSVIIPAWNSAKWLPTTIRGLQKQSWKNLEIIVVDDCSSDDTLAVAKALAAQDPRIVVLANETNRGAYGSRNWGAEISRGQYITVHDADDWSHPRKIERQVNHLVQNSELAANLSRSVRIEPDNLMFFAQYGREIMRQNSSSVMFARETVFETLGYWDEVKFGADTEFHHRIRSAFGPNSAPVANIGLLSLTRYHSESLTGGGKHSTQRGIVGARRDYVRKFDDWHLRGKELGESLYLERAVVDRPFPIPVSSAVDESNLASYDYLVIANLAIDTEWLMKVYRAAKKLKNAGKSVAFIHMPGLLRPTQQPSTTFEDLIVDAGVFRIYTENDCRAGQVWVQASSLATKNVLMPEINASSTQIVIDDASLEINLDSVADLAREYTGAKPTIFVSDRETKLAVELWKGSLRPETTIWKPDSVKA